MLNNPESKIKPRLPQELKRSASVSAIIHGDNEEKTNFYYVDSLERFKRDHATVDRKNREKQKERAEKILQKKRYIHLEKSNSLRKIENDNEQRLIDKQNKAHDAYRGGTKMSIYSYGKPIDPITLKYQKTERGKQLQYLEKQKQLSKMVRAHHIGTCNSSGYNIINGRPSLMIEDLVSNEDYPNFENKLFKYYHQFKIDPNPRKEL